MDIHLAAIPYSSGPSIQAVYTTIYDAQSNIHYLLYNYPIHYIIISDLIITQSMYSLSGRPESLMYEKSGNLLCVYIIIKIQ